MSLVTLKGSIVDTILAIGTIKVAVDAKLAAERAAVEASYAGQIGELETVVEQLRQEVVALAEKVGAQVYTPATGVVTV